MPMPHVERDSPISNRIPTGVTLADLKDMDDGKNKQSLLMSPTANILGTNTNGGNTAQGNAQSPTPANYSTKRWQHLYHQ